MRPWRERTVRINHRGTGTWVFHGTRVCIVLTRDSPAENDALYVLDPKTGEVRLLRTAPHLSYDPGRIISGSYLSADDQTLVGQQDDFIVGIDIKSWTAFTKDSWKLADSDVLAYFVGDWIIRLDKRNGIVTGQARDTKLEMEIPGRFLFQVTKYHIIICEGDELWIYDPRPGKQITKPASHFTYEDPVMQGDGVICYTCNEGGKFWCDLAGTDLTAIFNRFRNHRYLAFFPDGRVLFKYDCHFVSVLGDKEDSFRVPEGGWLQSIRRLGSNMFTYVTLYSVFLYTTSGSRIVRKRVCPNQRFTLSVYGENVVVVNCSHCKTFQIFSKHDSCENDSRKTLGMPPGDGISVAA